MNNKTNSTPPRILGGQNTLLIDKLCALLFALAPIAQHYYGLYVNAGFTIYLFIMIILLMRLLSTRMVMRGDRILPAVPMITFELYCLVSRIDSSERVLYSLFIIMFLVFIFNGYLNMGYVIEYATWLGCIATALLVIQYIAYYVFHHPLNFEPHQWLLPSNSRWNVDIVYKVGELYRPSGFFLEPSHFFLYTFPLSMVCILLPGMTKWRMRAAVTLSIGNILTTSGMGIAVIIGIWVLYFMSGWLGGMSFRQRLKKIFSARNIVIVFLILIGIGGAYLTVPVIRHSLVRIVNGGRHSSAISGRVRLVRRYIRSISGSSVIFGRAGINDELDFNVSGFYATYIRWGLIGIVVSYWFYLQGLLRLKGAYFWMNAIIVMLSFFTAHTHGTFYMMYFTSFLAMGYYAPMRELLSQYTDTQRALNHRLVST